MICSRLGAKSRKLAEAEHPNSDLEEKTGKYGSKSEETRKDGGT